MANIFTAVPAHHHDQNELFVKGDYVDPSAGRSATPWSMRMRAATWAGLCLCTKAQLDDRSWAEIGAALGMTKQAAMGGFRKYAEPVAPSFRRLYDEYRTLAGDSAEN